MARRVVISGLGAVTPFGVGAEPLWEGLLAGESRLRPIERFDPAGFPCRLAGEVKDFSGKDHVPKTYRKAVKVMARDIELAVAAARAAVADARLITRGVSDEPVEPTHRPQRVGCHVGAGLIAAETDELSMALASSRREDGSFDLRAWGGEGMNSLPPLWLLKYLPNMLACHVTIIHDARGPSNTITCAEASGTLSIGESLRVIERGDADACFSGGAESKINLMGLLRMDLAGRVAPTGDERDGARIVRPYDADARGAILGEGAGIVILEEADAARARGARVYAQVAGFGAGHSPRSPDPAISCDGLVRAIEAALDDAGVAPADVDAVVPLASGIPSMDADEANALRRVFGARTRGIPLVTITPNIGLSMAGAGGVAACVAALCVQRQTLPARLHAGRAPADLDAGPAPQRDARLRHVLVCGGALGGQNAALLLKAV